MSFFACDICGFGNRVESRLILLCLGLTVARNNLLYGIENDIYREFRGDHFITLDVPAQNANP